MKYSKGFERDFNWYLSIRHVFYFDGCSSYYNKKGEALIHYDRHGVSGKEAFYIWDSQGKIKPTKHPLLLHTLLKVKGSVNLQIKQWAQGRADGTLPGIEFKDVVVKEYNLPDWVVEAVENQKYKYYYLYLSGKF